MDRTFLLRKRAITTFLSRKRAITTFLSRKFMITRSWIAFEDFLGSSIAPQVMPPWFDTNTTQCLAVSGEDVCDMGQQQMNRAAND